MADYRKVIIVVSFYSCVMYDIIFLSIFPLSFILISLMFPIIGKQVFPLIDLDVVCMQFPAEQRRNYKNVFNAFTRISREEGITTLWRGSVATMGRAVVVNVSQLATYSQAKFLISTKCTYQLQILSISGEFISIEVSNTFYFTVNIPEGVGLHFSASMLSGFLTTFNSMPFDITKTR